MGHNQNFAMAPKPAPDVTHNLAALVTYLNAHAHRDLLDAIAVEELSFNQLQLLGRLRDNRSYRPTLQQAAGIMRVRKSSASVFVEQLARRGLVTREPDERDRRAKRIVITDRGREVITRLHRARLAHVQAFAAALDDDERKVLHEALAKVAERDEIAACRPLPKAA